MRWCREGFTDKAPLVHPKEMAAAATIPTVQVRASCLDLRTRPVVCTSSASGRSNQCGPRPGLRTANRGLGWECPPRAPPSEPKSSSRGPWHAQWAATLLNCGRCQKPCGASRACSRTDWGNFDWGEGVAFTTARRQQLPDTGPKASPPAPFS